MVVLPALYLEVRLLSGALHTAVSSEAWAKLCEWAILAGKGQLLLSGSVVHASLKAAVNDVCIRRAGDHPKRGIKGGNIL